VRPATGKECERGGTKSGPGDSPSEKRKDGSARVPPLGGRGSGDKHLKKFHGAQASGPKNKESVGQKGKQAADKSVSKGPGWVYDNGGRMGGGDATETQGLSEGTLRIQPCQRLLFIIGKHERLHGQQKVEERGDGVVGILSPRMESLSCPGVRRQN